jgi:diguanylate cyclase
LFGVALDLQGAHVTGHVTLHGAAGIAVGHETIDLIAAQSLAPHPQNYEMWLAYRMRVNADLTRAVDHLLKSGQSISEDAADSLYEKHMSRGRLSGQVLLTGERIARELNGLISALGEAGRDTDAYSANLDRAANAFDRGLDSANFRALIQELANATAKMAAKNKDLTQRLETSSREIEDMRHTLRRVRLEAMSDGLTGLANRKMFDETLKSRLAESQADRTNLCLLMCDIDHFKRFNDTWGHQTGDQIIRFVAASLRNAALGDSMAARYGGEEFALIMPRTALRVACATSEDLRKKVESKTLVRVSTGEDLGKITISIGIAMAKSNDTPSSLLERADACLYASKRGGRNRVTTEVDLAKVNAA